VVTVVVQVPAAAGTVTLSGGHVKPVSHKAGAHSVDPEGDAHAGRHGLAAQASQSAEGDLKASFRPTSGSSSSATAQVTFA
jgi:hypothetical protein